MNMTIIAHIVYVLIFAAAYILEQRGILPVGGANTIIAMVFGTTVAHNVFNSVNQSQNTPIVTNPVNAGAISSVVSNDPIVNTPTRG